MNRLEQNVPYASLPALVDGAAERFGEQTLWSSVDDDTRISFREFARATLQCANALNALGVGPGTHVAVMLPNVPAYVVTWMALARLGAVMVPVNTQYKQRELAYVLQNSATTFLVIDADCLAVFDAMENRDALVPPSHLIVHGTLDGKRAHDWKSIVDAAATAPLQIPPLAADSLMSIQFILGSTGLAK